MSSIFVDKISNDKIVYYPGMGSDVYFPFCVLNVNHVVAIDMCDYWCVWEDINNLKEVDKRHRFHLLIAQIRKKLSSCMSIQNWSSVIIDDEKYIFDIKFQVIGNDKHLVSKSIHYEYFKRMEDYLPSKEVQESIDVITTKGAEVKWRKFEENVKDWWNNVGYILVSPCSPDPSLDEDYKQWNYIGTEKFKMKKRNDKISLFYSKTHN